MGEVFKIESARVIAVDPSGAVRQLLSDVFRTQGFENMQAMSSVKDVVSTLEVEKVDYIVTPLMADQSPNGLQLLKLISETPELSHTRISFLLEEAELSYLPLAFSLGLLSWFTKPYNKDSITQELEKFKDSFAKANWDPTKQAAHYLFSHLKEKSNHPAQIDLARSLLNLYPGEPSYLFNMANPLFQLGMKDEAKRVLHQVKLLSQDQDPAVDALANDLFGADGIAVTGDAKEDILQLGTCAIIDNDAGTSKEIKEILGQLGVSETVEFSDGNAAWIWLQENQAPGVIFMEWRIPELTGPYLIQRIRKKFPCLPIVVVSSLIEPEDEPLISEMGVTALVRKPFDKQAFLKRLVTAIRQERLPTDVEIMERRIRQLLADRNTTEATNLKLKYMAESSIPAIRKLKIEAEFAYAEGDFNKARNLAAESLRGSPDSVMILNLLGKSLMQLHDYAASLRCFEKAQELSPKNIQRLCAIAEVNAELKKEDDSNSAIDEAKNQDASNGEIVQAEAKIAVSSGDTDRAKDIMAQMDSLAELIAYMNNKAVSLARCGQFNEGIELYRRTVASIPDKNAETKAIVIYNLALAFVRMGEQGEAAEALQSVIDIGASRVLKRSKSLKQRLEKAMAVGQVITLSGDSASNEPKKESSDEIGAAKGGDSERDTGERQVMEANRVISATVAISPGQLCCFRIFTFSEKLPPQVTGWFEKMPRFKIRHAIARAESRGADKLMAG